MHGLRLVGVRRRPRPRRCRPHPVDAARRPTIRMVADGSPLDPGAYCSTAATRRPTTSTTSSTLARSRAQFNRRGDLVLQSLHRTWPSVADLRHRPAATRSAIPLQANAYLTPANASGLAPHRDAHDVIVLQLHGSKQWHVEHLGDVHPRRRRHDVHPRRHPAQRAHHRTRRHFISPSGLIRVTYRDVVERLLAEGPAVLDAPLPIGYRRRSAGATIERRRSPARSTRLATYLAGSTSRRVSSANNSAAAGRSQRGRIASLVALTA